jgi:hypothetical protein
MGSFNFGVGFTCYSCEKVIQVTDALIFSFGGAVALIVGLALASLIKSSNRSVDGN